MRAGRTAKRAVAVALLTFVMSALGSQLAVASASVWNGYEWESSPATATGYEWEAAGNAALNHLDFAQD